MQGLMNYPGKAATFGSWRVRLLDTVPVFAADAAARMCAWHGVATYLYPHISHRLTPRPEPYALLLVGPNYVVAQDFVVSTLCGAWAK